MHWVMDKRVRAALFISIFIVVSWFTVVPWMILGIGINALPDPPQPQITHGEFPIKLVYEINGERKTIKDTLICDYDGIEANEGQGKYITWKREFINGQGKLVLLNLSDGGLVYFYTGNAGYYMGEPNVPLVADFPGAHYYKEEGNLTIDEHLNKDELYQRFKIKIVEWKPPKPVVNTFK